MPLVVDGAQAEDLLAVMVLAAEFPLCQNQEALQDQELPFSFFIHSEHLKSVLAMLQPTIFNPPPNTPKLTVNYTAGEVSVLLQGRECCLLLLFGHKNIKIPVDIIT